MQAKATRVEKTFEALSVDRANSRLLGVSVITEGDALGHGQVVDAETIRSIVELANAKPQGRVPVNYSHNWASWSGSDSIGDRLGYADNFRIDGQQVRADIVFVMAGSVTDKVDHVLSLAEKAPTTFGVSVVIDGYTETVQNVPYTRVNALYSADIVGVPAANPNGLFASVSNPQSMSTPETKPEAQAPKGDDQISLTAFQRVVEMIKAFTGSQPAEAAPAPAPEPQPTAEVDPQPIAEDDTETEDADEAAADAPESTPQAEAQPEVKPEEVAAVLSAMQPAAATQILNQFDAKTQASIRQYMKPSNPANPPQPQGGQVLPGPRNMQDSYSVSDMIALGAKYTEAKQNGPASGKRLKYKGTAFGVDFGNSAARARQWFPEWFSERVFADPLFQFLRPIPIDGAPTADVIQKQIVVADFATGSLWRRGAGDCGFDPAGTHLLNERTLTVRPMYVNDEICPNSFKDYFNGEVWVNDEIIPREAILMEVMFGRLTKELVRQMLYGDYNSGGDDNAIDGLTTLFTVGSTLAATDPGHIPAAQYLSQGAWDASNALANMQAIVDALPAEMYGREMFLALPPQYISFFWRNYIATYTNAALMLDAGQRNRLPIEVSDQVINLVPMQQLRGDNGGSNSVFLFTPDNLVYALSQYDESNPSAYRMWFNEEEQKVRWRIQANAGTQYVKGSELVIGRI